MGLPYPPLARDSRVPPSPPAAVGVEAARSEDSARAEWPAWAADLASTDPFARPPPWKPACPSRCQKFGAVTEAAEGLGQYSLLALIELRPTAIPATHIASRAAPKSWLFMAMIPLARSDNGLPADWFLEVRYAVRRGRRSQQAAEQPGGWSRNTCSASPRTATRLKSRAGANCNRRISNFR